MELIFATHNKNKVIEVKSLINQNINLLNLSDINFTDDINETAKTLEGNAILKAQTIFGKAVLLAVFALGLYLHDKAWYFSDFVLNETLCSLLAVLR